MHQVHDGDKTQFVSLTYKKGGNVVYGDNSRGKILSYVIVGLSRNKVENVSLVDGLKL